MHQGTRATLNRHGAAAARAAHNREDTRSKRVVGIHFNLPALQKQAVKLDDKRSWHWYNSEGEVDCRSKVVRSKLTVNAIQFASFTETGGSNETTTHHQIRTGASRH